MAKTLTHRLDDACRQHGLEWLVLPFEECRQAWARGPYWGALVVAQYQPRSGRAVRFYRYNGLIEWGPEKKPKPEVIYLTLEPMGRQEVKRLLLAQVE